jgi:hypothetical protein
VFGAAAIAFIACGRHAQLGKDLVIAVSPRGASPQGTFAGLVGRRRRTGSPAGFLHGGLPLVALGTGKISQTSDQVAVRLT